MHIYMTSAHKILAALEDFAVEHVCLASIWRFSFKELLT